MQNLHCLRGVFSAILAAGIALTSPRMDSRWLQDFLALAETRNFTRAAARRNTSQAAFSRRIQALEAWLGGALIDRASYPPALTPVGEHFRLQAAEILSRLADARGEVQGRPGFGRSHVRFALPYVLATARFGGWWKAWSRGGMSCALAHGNVLDLVGLLVNGSADIMICHETAQQPVQLDRDSVERLVLGQDMLGPWCAADVPLAASFPGSERHPTPLLMYTPAIYFARLVDIAIEAAPAAVHGVRVAESDMSDVLHQMAASGLGVAWLTDSTVTARGGELRPVGGAGWRLPLQIVAFCARGARKRSVSEVWEAMQATARAP
jgi:DNA-binding transcriptional LysR family regulator